MKTIVRVASLVVALVASAPSFAHSVIYQASLNGPSESPPNASPATGFTTVTIDLDFLTMRVEVNFTDLIGETTASHIHCCTAVPGVSTAGVATVTPTFTGFPLPVTSGTYDHTFDMTVASSYNAAFITANGGTVSTAFSALLFGLDAGKGYLNIHTTFAPGGEIRGFLQPTPAPAAVWLLGTGLAGLGGRRWFRRKISS